jgi:hypothetical protein
MVVHLAYSIPNRYDGFNYGTVCGLENKQSKDINATNIVLDVTCKKCLDIMKQTQHWRYKKYILGNVK